MIPRVAWAGLEDQGEAELTLTGVRGLRISRLTVEKVLRFVILI